MDLINMHFSWKKLLSGEFSAPYFLKLKEFLKKDQADFLVFPPAEKIFSAFNQTPFDEVKVVVIGQDPYHKKGQANGLSFSVSDGVKKPPSLNNIFKELETDIGVPIPQSGNLERWASQGVLLLNTTLTVREGEAASHQKQGWETFTDAVIRTISENKEHVVFLLWGKFAQSKAILINIEKHTVLNAAHPSPLARGAFFGSKHFSKTNAILKRLGKKEIEW